MTIDEKIAVMTAYKEGKEIESRPNAQPGDNWWKCPCPVFLFETVDYRIAPEGKPFQWNFDNAEALLGKMTRNEYCSSIIIYIDEIQFRHGVSFYKYNCTDNLEIKIDGNWIPFQDYKPENL